MNKIICLYCEAESPKDQQHCQACNAYLVVGRLTSNGKGILAQGKAFDMLPGDLTLGRSRDDNDFVVDSNLIAPTQCLFRYTDSVFQILDPNTPNRTFVNGSAVPDSGVILKDGDRVGVGVEEFVYSQFHARDNVSAISRSHIDIVFLQSISQLLAQVNSSVDLIDVFKSVVDAVLTVAGLHRGFGYLPGKSESDLIKVAKRVPGERDWDKDNEDHNYPICHDLMQAAFAEMYPVFTPTPDSGELPDEDDIGFQAVLCIPLCVYDSDSGRPQVRGMIYADSLISQAKTHDYVEPTLRIIGQIMTMAIIDDDRSTEKLDIALGHIDKLKNQVVSDNQIGARSKVGLVNAINNLTNVLEDEDDW